MTTKKNVSHNKEYPKAVAGTAERLQRRVEDSVSLGELSSFTLMLLCSNSWSVACSLAFLGEDMRTVGRHLSILSEATTQLFRMAFGVNEPHATIQYIPGKLPARTGVNSGTDPSQWRDGFYAAIVLRRVDILNELCGISSDALKTSTTDSENYSSLLMDLLQALLLHKSNASSLLLDVLRATDPKALKSGDPDWTLSIVVPSLEVMDNLLERDADAFNDALYRALMTHKDYWYRQKQKQTAGIEGLLSLPLLALVSIALDWGLPIEVESGFIPRRIYDPKEWPKKEDTSA